MRIIFFLLCLLVGGNVFAQTTIDSTNVERKIDSLISDIHDTSLKKTVLIDSMEHLVDSMKNLTMLTSLMGESIMLADIQDDGTDDENFMDKNKNENECKVNCAKRKNGEIIIIKTGEINSVITATITPTHGRKDTTLNKITYIKDKITHSKGNFTEIKTIDSVKYISKVQPSTQHTYSVILDDKTVIYDGDTSKDDLPHYTDKEPKHFQHPLKNISVASNNTERLQAWDRCRMMKKEHLYFAFTYMPAYSRDIVITKTQDNSLSDMASYRRSNETGIYGQVAAVNVGITMGVGSTLYGAALISEQGIKTLEHTVDWTTGLPVADMGNHTYRFTSGGFGIGYTYSDYNNHPNSFHAVFDMAVYCQNLWGATDNWYNTWSENRDVWSAKIGLGLSFRPRYSIECSLIPSIFWNFSNLDNSNLATKLVNFGVTGVVAFRPGRSNLFFNRSKFG